MTYISLPDNAERRLVFYLAMEEYVAAHLDRLSGAGEAFFLWQVCPTVIFGRNQVMEAEVNMDYCRRRGIQLYRRKSGGGCVYSDYGNIMLSYICTSTDVTTTFDRYLTLLAGYLRAVGIDAVKSGRNDIIVDGRKVSGNAFFLKPEAGIVHGTMLFDTDMDEMEKAITPSDTKVRSKGVASVRQHVANLKPHFGQSEEFGRLADIEEFKRYLAGCFCGADSMTLSAEQVAGIGRIEAEYLVPDFIEGRRHAYTLERRAMLKDVGEMCLNIDVDGDRIGNLHISGDFFTLKDGIEEELNGLLAGVRCTAGDIADAVSGLKTEEYIPGLQNRDMIAIIAGTGNSVEVHSENF